MCSMKKIVQEVSLSPSNLSDEMCKTITEVVEASKYHTVIFGLCSDADLEEQMAAFPDFIETTKLKEKINWLIQEAKDELIGDIQKNKSEISNVMLYSSTILNDVACYLTYGNKNSGIIILLKTLSINMYNFCIDAKAKLLAESSPDNFMMSLLKVHEKVVGFAFQVNTVLQALAAEFKQHHLEDNLWMLMMSIYKTFLIEPLEDRISGIVLNSLSSLLEKDHKLTPDCRISIGSSFFFLQKIAKLTRVLLDCSMNKTNIALYGTCYSTFGKIYTRLEDKLKAYAGQYMTYILDTRSGESLVQSANKLLLILNQAVPRSTVYHIKHEMERTLQENRQKRRAKRMASSQEKMTITDS